MARCCGAIFLFNLFSFSSLVSIRFAIFLICYSSMFHFIRKLVFRPHFGMKALALFLILLEKERM